MGTCSTDLAPGPPECHLHHPHSLDGSLADPTCLKVSAGPKQYESHGHCGARGKWPPGSFGQFPSPPDA